METQQMCRAFTGKEKGYLCKLTHTSGGPVIMYYKQIHRCYLLHVLDMMDSAAKGCLDHRFHATTAYTAELLTLHQHRANNQNRMPNQIKPTLRVSSNTQATLE